MPEARRVVCKITEHIWISPTVMKIRFEPNKKFAYKPGQFLSVFVPNPDGSKKMLRRAYSFASPYDMAESEGYELCVRLVPDGVGTTYLSELSVGDVFEATAPYGDFVYRGSTPDRSACFIATGTGIAPFRAMILSEEFQENPPEQTTVLFGLSSEKEIFYRGELESTGVNVIHAVPHASDDWPGFQGRVTDYLKELPTTWAWHSTDFYICGNPNMVIDVDKLLQGGHGVVEKSIYKELFLNPAMEKKEAG